MTNDLVSIIMPSYNCGKYVEETIRSVQAQTYSNWEIIFIDDCSTDDTIYIVTRIREKDKRVNLYQNAYNSGAAVSRNNALREAKGRWIAFLDSDDLWEPTKLEKQIKYMEDNGYHFSYTGVDVIDEMSNPLNEYWMGPKHITKRRMFDYDWVGCATVMYDSQVVGLIQIEDIKKNNDYAIWLKVIKKCDCYLLEEVLSSYRKRPGSISRHSKFTLIKWHYRLFRVCEHQNVLMALINTIRNLIYGTLRVMIYKKKK